MTAVFVHGVPETTHVWSKVRAELDTDSVAVSLPGFGVPVPDGFGATMDEYAAWLVGEVEAVGEPVDLVGHDWGALLTGRLVSIRHDLVRSWVADTVGGFDPVDWEWHQFAQLWQTPGDGEEFFRSQRQLRPADLAPVYVGLGVPEDDALAMIEATDETMDDCILKLYRSAVDVEERWGPELGKVPVPALVVLPTDDPFNVESSVRRVAERTGARLEVLGGMGHWWPYQDPARGAAVLRDFWASL